MQKNFDPAATEKRWYQIWEERGYFKPGDSSNTYSIMIPPPNVTGGLHMGHAFQQTIMDALIRYHRMCGKSVLWQVGTDHAGIATQTVVERKLAAEGEASRQELGREHFIGKIWEWKKESGGTISQQMRRLGNSVDWGRERFTMDDGFSRAVIEVFVQLYEQDLIYRGKRLVNWDPGLHTAISDLEVESKDQKGHLWHFRYPLADGVTTTDGATSLIVATTRPETMLGDAAVAVHPDDERYRDLIGKDVIVPLTDRRVPIVADDYVDREFGTGCVKITPAHDFNDYEVGQRHSLPMINVMTQDGRISAHFEIFNSTGEPAAEDGVDMLAAYAGLDRFAARTKIVADLQALDLLADTLDHELKVPYGDRSGEVIEPLLTDQWYVRVDSLARPAIEAVEKGDITFVPKSYENMYFGWMRSIQDWCISRQLWWGHRIPAWYDQEGGIYVGRSETEVRSKYDLGDTSLHQDEDVLDTWFSSALWTFSTLGWPEDTRDLKRFHPTDVLVTGFDIIFFWVARMIMMTLHFRNEIPFRTVYVTGLIRDEHGQKMSKSKGNVIDPLDMIDGISADDLVAKRTGNMMQPQSAEKIAQRTRKEFPDGIQAQGTDALRFTLAALASTGRDINWDMGRLEGYHHFCNKLWNASRYVLINTQDHDPDSGIDVELSAADRWILSQLQQVIAEVRESIEGYRFDRMATRLYEFIWNQYCDWYLELSKPVLLDNQFSAASKQGTRQTLLVVLDNILRLCHPLMPFITEEIWTSVAPLCDHDSESLMCAPYPDADQSLADPAAEQQIDWLKAVIVGIRNIRGEMNISPAKTVPVLLREGDDVDRHNLEANRALLRRLANLGSISWLDTASQAPMSSTALVGGLEVLIPMAGIIDKEAELARLEKEMRKLAAEMSKMNDKLGNDNFIGRAPEEVVARERARLEKARDAAARMDRQILELKAL